MKKILIAVFVVAILLMGTVAFAASLTDEQKDFLDFKKGRVDNLVESGRITEEQADEYLENLESKLLDGTCDGTGENCENGEDCSFGLNGDGECLGLGGGRGCGRFTNEDQESGCGKGFGGGRGCGRN